MTIENVPRRGSDPHAFATASLLGALVALVRELSLSGCIDPKRYALALDALQAQSVMEVVSDNDRLMTEMVIRVLKEAASKEAGDEQRV